MKRPLTILTIAVLTILVIYACGSTIPTGKTSFVTITIGGNSQKATLHAEKATTWSRVLHFLADAKLTPKAYAAIPSVVKVVIVTVSAPDMTTMVTVVPVAGLTDIAITLEVPNGTGRNFLVEGFDDASIVVYRGQASADLKGDPVSLTINLDSVTSADTTPPAFAGATLISNITGTTAQLSWSAATDNVTPPSAIVYLIYQSTAPSGEIYTAPTYTTPAGATSYTVAGLSEGTAYYFVVRARDEAGNIDDNTIERTTTTPDTIPPAFSGLSMISNITTTTMLLSWPTATDNVTPQANIVYLIYQATAPGGESFASPTYTTAAGAASYTVTGLALGNTYYFVVRARDAAGNSDGNTVELSGFYPGTYVNVGTGTDQGGCGAPDNPCQTITYALSQSVDTDNANILVAPGVYSSASVSASETFPLQLWTGTSLFCYGPNFSTVIDDSAGLGNTIITGAQNALVDGCMIVTASGASNAAIDDLGSAMTVNNCSVNGSGNASTGIQLSTTSAVFNSTINGFLGSDGNGVGIRVAADALISGNTVTGNYYGIYSSAGSPDISNNAFTGNSYGIYIWDGSPTINNNTITNNSTGIESLSGSATVSPVISNNVISGGFYGIFTYSGTWTISGNTISGNTSFGIEFNALLNIGGTITGNTIINNGVGIDMTGGSTITYPSINNNSLSCNTTADLNTNAFTPINVTNNSWDHSPPLVQTSTTVPCSAGQDICYSGAAPNFSPNNTTVPSSCP